MNSSGLAVVGIVPLRWPRQVPWCNWSEWNHVFRCLFDGDTQTPPVATVTTSVPTSSSNVGSSSSSRAVFVALEYISVWKLRGRVPHSVEMSALLVDLITKDNNSTTALPSAAPYNSNNNNSCPRRIGDNMDLRLQYSMLIVRAVNGLVDDKQQGQFAESVMMLGDRIGS
jgi:hypothetical protein